LGFAFFLAFFGWFGIAPLMALVRDDLGLTRAQVGNTIIASVAITMVVRLVIGWLCDRIGPRSSYTGLLVAGSIPVMTIGLAQNYETFLLFWLAIGWRVAMVIPGAALLLVGIAYYFLTQGSPEGNYRELQDLGKLPSSSSVHGLFLAARDC
jgi:nitrate/nitrite transporter NarK